MMIVYLITNTVNGKAYVGITAHPNSRWNQHRSDAKCKTRNSPLHAAIRKYGERAFVRSVLAENLTKAEAQSREILEIAERRTLTPFGYNLTPGGELAHVGKRARYWLGKKRSPEFCEKMRVANLGRSPSASTRAKLSVANKGKKIGVEQRKALSIERMGQGNPQYGKSRTRDERFRISTALIGLKRDAAFKAELTQRMRSDHPTAKLDHCRVKEIYARRKAGETLKTLASDYGVSVQTVCLIGTGERWGWLTGAT